jgi:multicomponent Na+:H+ antiporter subunit E
MPGNASSLKQSIVIFLISLLLWMMLVGRFDGAELITGCVVALVVAILAGPRAAIFSGLRLTPLAPLHLIRYLGYFSVALVRANLDMARRVLSPSLPIRPAVVEVATTLRSDLGRLLLANSITLTPGTLSVDVREERILVHWVDCPPDVDLTAATADIAAGFERHLKGFLE